MFSRTRFRVSFCIAGYGILASSCGLISLNYIPRTSPVPPDLGLSVAAPFSYHNGASHENRGEASNLLRNFTVVLHIFVLQFSLCDVNWVSQRIHSFILTVSYSVLYISNTSIIMIFYNTLLQM